MRTPRASFGSLFFRAQAERHDHRRLSRHGKVRTSLQAVRADICQATQSKRLPLWVTGCLERRGHSKVRDAHAVTARQLELRLRAQLTCHLELRGEALIETNNNTLCPRSAIGQVVANLAGQPPHISFSLKQQLVAVEAALLSASPDAARRLRRLVDFISYIESMTGQPADSALTQIRELASNLLKTHAVN